MHTFYTIFNRFLSSLSLSLSLRVGRHNPHHHNFFACFVKHAKKQNPPPTPLAACRVEKLLARRQEVSTRPLKLTACRAPAGRGNRCPGASVQRAKQGDLVREAKCVICHPQARALACPTRRAPVKTMPRGSAVVVRVVLVP